MDQGKQGNYCIYGSRDFYFVSIMSCACLEGVLGNLESSPKCPAQSDGLSNLQAH